MMIKTIRLGDGTHIKVKTDFDNIDDYLMNAPTEIENGNAYFCAVGSKDEKWYRIDDVCFEEVWNRK